MGEAVVMLTSSRRLRRIVDISQKIIVADVGILRVDSFGSKASLQLKESFNQKIPSWSDWFRLKLLFNVVKLFCRFDESARFSEVI